MSTDRGDFPRIEAGSATDVQMLEVKGVKRIEASSATDVQMLEVKGVAIHALGMGYTAPGNRPDNTARIEITGKASLGTISRFVLLFYPVGDGRLVNPFYDKDRTTLSVTQTLAALPGWIAALTAIPVNEQTIVVYYATADRYEFECVRTLTRD